LDGVAPAPLAFAADADAFTPLGGQHLEVAGVGVTPAQVVLQFAGQYGVVGVVGGAEREAAQRADLRLG
jgi:hypothetical protein